MLVIDRMLVKNLLSRIVDRTTGFMTARCCRVNQPLNENPKYEFLLVIIDRFSVLLHLERQLFSPSRRK